MRKIKIKEAIILSATLLGTPGVGRAQAPSSQSGYNRVIDRPVPLRCESPDPKPCASDISAVDNRVFPYQRSDTIPGQPAEITEKYQPPKKILQWQPPDPGLAGRLKESVNHIVHNFPDRHNNNLQVLDKLADHVEVIFSGTGGRVYKQEVFWKGNVYQNVLASYGPESGPCIVIGAHYDAVQGSPAADDNASALAVLLELAKYLGDNPPPVHVELAAYPLEEVGLIGSAAHAKSLRTDNIEVAAMLSLEMVGYYSDEPKSQHYPVAAMKLFYPSKGNFICVVGKTSPDNLVDAVKKNMAKTTPLSVKSFKAPLSKAKGMIERSDHASFWAEGYPAVMITDTAEFRNKEYHKANDVPGRLDYNRMAMVAEDLKNVIFRLYAK